MTNKNLLWLLVEDIGLDEVRSRVKRPLKDLKVGPFYGCYIIRPTDRLGIDEEKPRDRYLHQLIEALGGTVIQYAGQHKCCGFPIITMNKEASLKQAGRHIGDAIDAAADCLVTPCPLCHLNLDLQQPLAERIAGRELGLPILHLPQLLGLALGLEPGRARPVAPRRQADGGGRLVPVGRRGRGRRRLVVRSPLRAFVERLRGEPERKQGDRPLACMADGAEEFQTRLDEARERLRREIPPPPEE